MSDHIESQEKQMARLNPNNERASVHEQRICEAIAHAATGYQYDWSGAKAAVAALEAERDAADMWMKEWEGKMLAAEADRDRYAAALREIERQASLPEPVFPATVVRACLVAARAALKDKTP